MAKVILIFEDVGKVGENKIDVDIDYRGWSGEVEEATPAVKFSTIIYRLATVMSPQELFDFAKNKLESGDIKKEAEPCGK